MISPPVVRYTLYLLQFLYPSPSSSIQVHPHQVLYKFLYLLEQSNVDHAEEAELKKYKANIVKEIRHNQQLEKELNEMDIKIGKLEGVRDGCW